MRTLLIIITCIGVLFGCTSTNESRLFGTWVSDSKATVDHNRSISPEMDWNKYSQLFGRMKVAYDKQSATFEMDGIVERREFHVVGRDSETVTLSIHNRVDRERRLLTIHFVDADTYWINIRDTNHREYFRRQKQSEK